MSEPENEQGQPVPEKPKKAEAPPREVDLKVVANDSKTVVTGLPVNVEAPRGYDRYMWNFPPGISAAQVPSAPHVLKVQNAPNGVHAVTVSMFKGTVKKAVGNTSLEVLV